MKKSNIVLSSFLLACLCAGCSNTDEELVERQTVAVVKPNVSGSISDIVELFLEGNPNVSEFDRNQYLNELSVLSIEDYEDMCAEEGTIDDYVKNLTPWKEITVNFTSLEGQEVTLTGYQRLFPHQISDLDWVCGEEYSFRISKETVLVKDDEKSRYDYTGFYYVEVYVKEGNMTTTYRTSEYDVEELGEGMNAEE